MTEPKLLANIIRTPDGTILQSFHRHDFKTHEDSITKQIYGVDGGISYQRRIGGICEDLSVYTDDPHEEIRKHFHWGTYGVDGGNELKFVRLCEMSSEHILAVLKNVPVVDHIRKVFNDELTYRTVADRV